MYFTLVLYYAISTLIFGIKVAIHTHPSALQVSAPALSVVSRDDCA